MKKILFTVALLAGMIFSVSAFDNFAQAIAAGDEALAAGNKDKATKCYVEAANMLGLSREIGGVITKLKKLGKWQEVADIYKKLGESNAYYYDYHHKTMAKLGKLNLDDAIADFTKASAKKPEFLNKKWYWMLRKKDYDKVYKEGLAVMNDAKNKPGVRFKGLQAAQNSLFYQKKYDEGFKLGDEQLSNPVFTESNKMLIFKTKAHTLKRLRRYEEAVKAFDEAAKCKIPNRYKVENLMYQADLLYKYMHKPEEAQKSIDKARKFDAKYTNSPIWKRTVSAVEAITARKKAAAAEDKEEDNVDK